jgi:oxygen-independent coproporphyrinogen-3 oxidase
VRYTAALQSARSPAAGREVLDDRAKETERVMLAVRMRAGLAVAEVPGDGARKAEQLLGWELLEPDGYRAGRVVLTQRGRLLADAVVRDLLD